MPVSIIVPDLGAGEEAVRLSTWFVDIGDAIISGDRVLELLIPGVTFDLSAPCSGRLAEVTVREGARVRAGDVLGSIVEE